MVNTIIAQGSDIQLADYQWEFDGFLFGEQTDYGLKQIEGWDAPNVRVSETEKMNDHGSFITAQFLSSRAITLSGDVFGTVDDGDFDNKLTTIGAAFGVPHQSPVMLRRKISAGTRVVFCKPIKYSLIEDTSTNLGYAQWAAQFLAEDPRIYDDILTNLSTGPATFSGFSFDAEFGTVGINFGGGSSGGISAFNYGSVSTPPIITIYGPGSNPKITSLTASKTLKLNLDLGATDYVTIDALSRTIFVNGEASRYYTLVDPFSWFYLFSGLNQLYYAVENGSGSVCTVTYRSAWTAR